MIRRLTGTVVSQTQQTVTLEVAGVGYLVFTPQAERFSLEASLTLHTHLAVRETALDLYGFELMDELELFERLLSLPKIGPKSALQILTQANLELITKCVFEDDPAQLSKLSGMGKKTAEKVVSGLRDSYEKSGTPLAATATTSEVHDAIDALVTLGYPQESARKAVQEVTERIPGITETNAIIKHALQQLS